MRLIDADRAEENSTTYSNLPLKGDAYDAVMEFLDNQPTVDAEPVIHAHWIPSEDNAVYSCTNCGLECDWHYNFCHFCGAKMDEVQHGN